MRPQNTRFCLEKRLYGQFFQLYFMRLALCLPRLRLAAAAAWPGVPCRKVLEVEEGVECVVFGTLYKEMRLKPSILDEYVKEAGELKAPLAAAKLGSEEDSLVLEDEGSRLTLRGDAACPAGLSTGVAVAARGTAQGSDFVVRRRADRRTPADGPRRAGPGGRTSAP